MAVIMLSEQVSLQYVARPSSDWFVATPIGVVDYCIEALVSPLPKYDAQRVPARVMETAHSTLLHR